MKDIQEQEHIAIKNDATRHIHILNDWHKRIAPWQTPYSSETHRHYMPGTGEPIETPDHTGQTFDSELSQWETDGGNIPPDAE